MDMKEGCQVLSKLCETELDTMKRNGIHSVVFSEAENYALRHGVRHMLEARGDQVNPHHLSEIVKNYVTDLELIYAKLCLGDTGGSDDLLNLTKQEYFKLLHSTIQCAVTTALSVSRKHKPVLRRQPQHFFQAILNEGGHEYATKALQILQNKYPEIPYIEILNKKDKSNSRRVQARFECDSLVACFDVSPQMDYMVCECVNKSIQLWSLGSGDRRWTRDALTVKPYGFPLNQNCALRDSGESFIYEEKRVWNPSLSFYRSVVFHPGGEWVLPGSIRDVFTINGDLVPLFPASNCRFIMCAFSGDRTKMLTDCPDNPENAVMWNMSDGKEIIHFQRKKNVLSLAFSLNGTLVAISDCTHHTGLYKVGNLNCELLCEISSPYIFGLMNFSPDSQKILCCYVEPELCSEIEMTCFIYNVPGPEEPVVSWEEPYLSWWPWEIKSLDEGKFLLDFSEVELSQSLSMFVSYRSGEEWGLSLSMFVPSYGSGFFSLISEGSLLVGSPYSSEVWMVNLGENAGYSRCDVYSDVKLSFDGKFRYVMGVFEHESSGYHGFDGDSESEDDNDYTSVTVEVRVYNEEDKVIITVDQFPHPLLLLPVREGVLLLKSKNELELWDFGLCRCIRTFSEINSVVDMFLVSEELVGCRTDSSKVDIFRIADNDMQIVETTTVEENVTSVTCNSRFHFVACGTVEVPSDMKLFIASITAWTQQQRLWKRSIITENNNNVNPSALIARNDDLVVVWKTFDQGNGVHVLNATTGLTLHKLLTDQKVFECEFLSDGKHFVCCSDDGTSIPPYSVFSAISGELISFIALDAGDKSLGSTSCFHEPLFAVGLEFPEYKLFRVYLPEVKGSERREKRFVLMFHHSF